MQTVVSAISGIWKRFAIRLLQTETVSISVIVKLRDEIMDGRLSRETEPIKPGQKQRISAGRHFYIAAKRCFDFVSSFCAGIVLLIPMAVIALLIMMKDPGSPFYMHKRLGQNGAEIGVLKFRSMKKNADHLEKMLTPEQIIQYKKEFKLKDDPRLIGYQKAGDGKKCFGAILRQSSMDELPQIIWNICIKGNMSVVGPRPILYEELLKNYTPEEQKLFLRVKPGLTGYWQAYARNDAGYQNHRRQDMELYYIKNASVWLDIKIIFATIGAVIRKNSAW